MNCEYCNNTFSSKTNLQKHQKYTKYCLKLQGKEEHKFKCSGCGKNYTSAQNLELHGRKCKYVYSKNKEQEIDIYKQKLKDMEDDYKKKLLFQSERHTIRINSIYESHQLELKQLKEKEKENKDLQDTIKKIAVNAVSIFGEPS